MKNPQFNTPERIEKEWGEEIIIESNDYYCFKILHYRPGAKSSCHAHICKTETWFVQSGVFKLYWFDQLRLENKEKVLQYGDVVHLPASAPHEVYCLEGGKIFEASTYDHPDDIVRFNKSEAPEKNETIQKPC